MSVVRCGCFPVCSLLTALDSFDQAPLPLVHAVLHCLSLEYNKEEYGIVMQSGVFRILFRLLAKV
jgi:hypothetical protein